MACSLTSLDGLSDGATDSPAEGGPEATTTADGAVDADATATSDAKPDGASFCASAPAGAFCDDFENGLSKWSSDTSNGNGFVIDDASSTSPSHAAFSTLTAQGSSCLRKSFPGSAESIVVDVDVRFDSLSGGDADYDFLGLRGSDNHNLTLQVRERTVEYDEDIEPVDGGGDDVLTSTDYDVDSAWHHYHWTHKIDGDKASVGLTIDGANVKSKVADARDYASPLTFELGDCVASPSGGAWKVRFDNVVIVVK